MKFYDELKSIVDRADELQRDHPDLYEVFNHYSAIITMLIAELETHTVAFTQSDIESTRAFTKIGISYDNDKDAIMFSIGKAPHLKGTLQ